MKLLAVPPEWEGDILAMGITDDGRMMAIRRFIYTYGLHVNVKLDGAVIDFSARYCYENPADAYFAMLTWDGKDDPPGMWIKEKVSERLGPGALQ